LNTTERLQFAVTTGGSAVDWRNIGLTGDEFSGDRFDFSSPAAADLIPVRVVLISATARAQLPVKIVSGDEAGITDILNIEMSDANGAYGFLI
jgi:hypothetical protein